MIPISCSTQCLSYDFLFNPRFLYLPLFYLIEMSKGRESNHASTTTGADDDNSHSEYSGCSVLEISSDRESSYPPPSPSLTFSSIRTKDSQEPIDGPLTASERHSDSDRDYELESEIKSELQGQSDIPNETRSYAMQQILVAKRRLLENDEQQKGLSEKIESYQTRLRDLQALEIEIRQFVYTLQAADIFKA